MTGRPDRPGPPGEPPRRTVVASPATRRALAARAAQHRLPPPPERGTAAHGVGARPLLRRQFALGGACALFVLGTMMTLPALFALVPWLDDLEIAGTPLAWIVVTLGAPPSMAAVLVLHVSRAERLEQWAVDEGAAAAGGAPEPPVAPRRHVVARLRPGRPATRGEGRR
ncbi:hypothetical protein [Marinactinospora rubrisoli]|uniref:DUF485 domain-containing protein n=1 Tax=Marinactinospora rubrisoli TaxID=2715399 RepID=A0ABW2KM69_9ACTN